MGIKHLVAKAACFQVGNGASIRIWSDPWIPNFPGFIPTPKEGANSDLALVLQNPGCSLLNLLIGSREWFLLPPILMLTCCPLKRIAANLLPSKEIISRFNESMDLRCPLCNSAMETTLHIFTVCPFAKSLWFQSQWGLKMDVLNFDSPSEFVKFLLSPTFASNFSPSHREEFLLFGAILCDVIWKQRNRSIFENVDINLEGVAAKIFSLFVEHKSARPPLVRPQVSLAALGWNSPPRHGLKINVDAAVGPKFSVIATVTRDWRGRVVFTGSRKVNTTFPLQVEAEVVRWALTLVPDLRCDSVSVEIDSQVVANLISNSSVPPLWRIRFLCFDLRSFLSSYSNVVVSWVPRICNEAAHILAKWSLFWKFYGSFDVSFSSDCFSPIVLRESSGLV
ncbi:uncharacterized protein LOC142612257 [Castanea sativa]|uniref:uncharacterized protein LOC142612257 n=1 Tax=Castanea sativa TaxID=21020 RepID=UPI003F649930